MATVLMTMVLMAPPDATLERDFALILESLREDDKQEKEAEKASEALSRAFLDAQKRAGIVPENATEPKLAAEMTISEFAEMDKITFQAHIRKIHDLELKLAFMEQVRRERKRQSLEFYRRNYQRPDGMARAHRRKARIAAGIPAMKHAMSRNAGNLAAEIYWKGFVEGLRKRVNQSPRSYPNNYPY